MANCVRSLMTHAFGHYNHNPHPTSDTLHPVLSFAVDDLIDQLGLHHILNVRDCGEVDSSDTGSCSGVWGQELDEGNALSQLDRPNSWLTLGQVRILIISYLTALCSHWSRSIIVAQHGLEMVCPMRAICNTPRSHPTSLTVALECLGMEGHSRGPCPTHSALLRTH